MNILITGVGGQGTILASKLIAQGAIMQGLEAKTSETIGMAQRGGSVVSHVRIGADKKATMIPKGQADLILGFEPGEAARYIQYLKPEGHCITNSNGIMPITASLGGHSYDSEAVCGYLKETLANCTLIDGQQLCAEVGSPKVLNVILLAVAASKGLLPFDQQQLLDLIALQVKPQFLVLNQKAVEVGYQVSGDQGKREEESV